jgi:hypothetical protein
MINDVRYYMPTFREAFVARAPRSYRNSTPHFAKVPTDHDLKRMRYIATLRFEILDRVLE